MVSEFSSTLFLDALDKKLADIEVASTIPGLTESSDALDAAAVLHVFDPTELYDRDGMPIGSASSDLLRESYQSIGFRHKGYRSLRERTRLHVLSRIGGAKKALDYVQANISRNLTAEQRMFEELLQGSYGDLRDKTRTELNALRNVTAWARAVGVTNLPDEMEVSRALDYARAVEPIEHLFVEAFVGRKAEMNALRAFVGITEPTFWRSITSVFSNSETHLVMLDGVGGVGKTALLGHFLYQHRADEKGPLFPFAYLACDDHRVSIDAPEGMLWDAAQQLERIARVAETNPNSNRADAVGEAIRQFQKQSSIFANQMRRLGGRRQDYVEQSGRIDAARDAERNLAYAFAKVVDAASVALHRGLGNVPPTLIILDSFEEVQYRSPEALDQFWDIMADIVDAAPTFRLLISGRSPLHKPRSDLESGVVPLVNSDWDQRTALEYDEIHLDKLLTREAVELLQTETRLAPRAASVVVRAVGSNPLNLRLAAQLLLESEKDTIEIDELQRRGFFRLGPEMIRGVLYRRVLDHIHDEDVRTLAHPGMVVRRVTPEIIWRVLGPACDLEGIDETRANTLFSELQREHTLVRLDDDDSLRFRPDVRQTMVSLLQSDRPSSAKRVHEAAIDYYWGKQDPISIAEFLYHRLMLGDTNGLEVDWSAEVEERLRDGIDDLPAEGKVWLAQYMRVDLPEDVRQQADVALWEQITGPRALLALQHESAGSALSILRERSDRTLQSPLFAVEARCLLSLELIEEALVFLEDALDDYPADGNSGRRAELLWLLYQVEIRTRQTDSARETLQKVMEATRELNSKIAHVQVLTEYIERFRRDDLWSSDDNRYFDELVVTLRNLPEADIYNEQDIVRAGLANVPRVFAATLGRQFQSVFTSIVDNLVAQEKHWKAESLQAIAEKSQAADNLPQEIFGMLQQIHEEVSSDGKGPTLLSRLIRLAESCLEFLVSAASASRGGSKGQDAAQAADILWLFLQLETGSFSAATLGGIQDYREPWELSASRVATV